MAFRSREDSELNLILRCGASALALCAMAAATPASAQTAGTDPVENSAGQAQGSEDGAAPETRIADQTDVASPETSPEEDGAIVVTGIRQSLANAQNIKRNADTVVDAITAEDIGALPDRSVTEALQRVPGVAINRFAAGNDPDHFSVEGSGVVVRGLNFVRSEFNGRDTFSANNGRMLGFADVPAELLGSVEVYKNVTAEMIEGGLAGTVNLNTRVPFDNKGFHFGFGAELNYGDFKRDVTPVISGLISNTWDTEIGRFGLLGSVAYSQLKSRADGLGIQNFQTRDNTQVICANADDPAADICTRNPLPGMSLAYAPLGVRYTSQEYNRERLGIAGAAQWESNDRTMLLTAQFLRSDARSRWTEHTFAAGPDLAEYNTYPFGCLQSAGPADCPAGQFENYQYDDQGVFESGYITFPGSGWRAPDSGGTWRTPTGGVQHELATRGVDQTTVTTDYGLNFKWEPSDRWSVNLDGQYVKATTRNLDVSIMGATFADTELDLTGDIPRSTLHRPAFLSATWSGAQCGTRSAAMCTPNQRINGQDDAAFFSDPANYFWRSAMDHIEQSDGTEWAFKADVAYDFQDDIPGLRKIKFGARYADRDQTVRSSAYNWGALSEVWAGAGPVWFDQTDSANQEFFAFPNFFKGDTSGPVGGWYYAHNPVKTYGHMTDFARSIVGRWNAGGANQAGWTPLAVRSITRPDVIEGTPFRPNEINAMSEATKAAYVMLSFGSDDPVFAGITIDGNIGVRYVHTSSRSNGFITFPSPLFSGRPFSDDPDGAGPIEGTGVCDRRLIDPDEAGPLPPILSDPPSICALGQAGYAAAQQFSNAAAVEDIANSKYGHWLPSLNVKFGLTPQLLVRFGASKVLTRPETGYVRNFLSIGTDQNNGFRFTANAGNPFIRPATAKTFDLSLEWYFAKVGSLTGALFYKDINGFFFQNVLQREFTNNGVTQTIDVRGPDNYKGGGSVKGFEVAYQQTFDFLPGFLNGFGVNANYTFVKSKGVPNAMLSSADPGAGGPNAAPPVAGNLPLEGLSKHNYNLTAFYEKGPISLRASYSWRSKFLLTVRDVIHPFFPVYNDDSGQLDASAFYSVNDQIKVGIQAVNLNNNVTKTIQVFTADGKQGPRQYFTNDRRFSFILRGNF
jgi:TonB-dependent receptor